MSAYLLLFATAFAAATVLPLSSELLLLAQVRSGLDVYALWLFATIGNTLGSLLNWALGRWLMVHVDKPWFPTNPTDLARAQNWFSRYGLWTLLFAWLPIGGDALTFVAGVLKVRVSVFLILVATGKGLRYAVVISGALLI